MTDDQLRKLLKEEFATFGQGVFDYLNERFGEVDQRFRQIDQRIDKLQAKLDTKADADQVDGLYNRLDGLIASFDRLETEYHAVSNHLDRHKGWITQVAKSTKTKLVPEP